MVAGDDMMPSCLYLFFIRLYLSGKNISVLASFKLIQVDTMLSQLGYVVKIKTQNTEHEKYLAHEEYCQQVIDSKLI